MVFRLNIVGDISILVGLAAYLNITLNAALRHIEIQFQPYLSKYLLNVFNLELRALYKRTTEDFENIQTKMVETGWNTFELCNVTKSLDENDWFYLGEGNLRTFKYKELKFLAFLDKLLSIRDVQDKIMMNMIAFIN